ncbi:TetR/AcrR family transcriptional regulator [Aureimonas phyllosphaerae]|uniref:AcrR family transcriptional regulator n=1 Tax=Aureimonas phyllosphaerae TaxID=1166078 RepID=A0A7W6C0C2_9HYPH|nr:TetR/AcrR family transcriptional regulator [Aureimonas phyllosphaerae]MBB3937031.1 AcrR family transcriptional regulator [Aureimonas phyllosphaerae]MBB3960854.1 AcrR family transcriptional regulator [Aureimonas phyllosphaerae]
MPHSKQPADADRTPPPPMKVGSRTRGRPSPQEAQQLTELILSIARRLFIEKGFEETSIDEICAIGKMSKKTFYARFGEKQDLFRAVVGVLVNEIILDARSKVGRRPDENLHDYLTRVALDLLSYAIRADVVALDRLMIAATPKFPGLIKTYEGARRSAADLIVPFIAEAQARGEIREADPHKVAEHFLGFTVMERMRTANFGVEPNHVTDEDVATTAERVDVFLNGYLRRTPI